MALAASVEAYRASQSSDALSMFIWASTQLSARSRSQLLVQRCIRLFPATVSTLLSFSQRIKLISDSSSPSMTYIQPEIFEFFGPFGVNFTDEVRWFSGRPTYILCRACICDAFVRYLTNEYSLPAQDASQKTMRMIHAVCQQLGSDMTSNILCLILSIYFAAAIGKEISADVSPTDILNDFLVNVDDTGNFFTHFNSVFNSHVHKLCEFKELLGNSQIVSAVRDVLLAANSLGIHPSNILTGLCRDYPGNQGLSTMIFIIISQTLGLQTPELQAWLADKFQKVPIRTCMSLRPCLQFLRISSLSELEEYSASCFIERTLKSIPDKGKKQNS